jgi:uncharacterized phage-associated protein
MCNPWDPRCATDSCEEDPIQNVCSFLDVAKYILEKENTIKNGPLIIYRVQKLLYYCQAWSLVWNGEKLFKERIEAWLTGPAIPELYELAGRDYELGSRHKIFAKACEIKDEKQRDTIDRVMDSYGAMTTDAINDLTRSEEPWKKAREGLPPKERSNNEVKLCDMLEYYSSIPPNVP